MSAFPVMCLAAPQGHRYIVAEGRLGRLVIQRTHGPCKRRCCIQGLSVVAYCVGAGGLPHPMYNRQ